MATQTTRLDEDAYPRGAEARLTYELNTYDQWYRSKDTRLAKPFMNDTIKQIEAMFPDFTVRSHAVDGMGRLSLYLGRFAYNKYITRLCCAGVYMAASSWHRARIVTAVQK